MGQKINILVVDDEEIMRNLFTDILREKGYEVTAAPNGKDAQEKAKQELFHMAFVDVHMPIMNGIQTLRALKEISPDIVIVMMDSFSDILAGEARKEDVFKCLHKPFSIEEVLEIVEDAVRCGESTTL